jgi:hypothetical protein
MSTTMLRAIGPWTGPGLDKDYMALNKWETGDILECQVYHDNFESAGSVIMIVLDQPVKEQNVYECHCVTCEDSYYKYYVETTTGVNPGLYIPAQSENEESQKVGSRTATPIFQWRLLNANGLETDLTKVRWLKEHAATSVKESLRDKRAQLQQPTPGERDSGGPAPPGSLPFGGGTPSLVGPSPSGSQQGVGTELRALAAELSGGTPEAQPEPPRKRKAEEPEPAAGNGERPLEANPGKHGEPPEAANGHGSKKARPLEAEKPRKAPEPVPTLSATDGSAESKRKKKKDNKHKKKNSRKKKKDKKKKKSKKHKKKKGKTDTSPSGSEPSDSSGSSYEEDSSDSSESLFRLASRSSGKVSQARLVAWSKAHPGRLASRCMQKMQDRTGREGEQVEWPKGFMPPAATSYYLRVLSLGTSQGSLRTLREMKTLCAVLDLIAHGKVLEAADVLAQRLKALELAAEEGGWASAQYLELIPQDKGTLVSGDERHMLKREQESALRLNSTPLPTPWGGGSSSKGGWPTPDASWQGKGWWSPWNTSQFQPTWKGKGKGKVKGGKKGKSKDKGDTATPPPPT